MNHDPSSSCVCEGCTGGTGGSAIARVRNAPGQPFLNYRVGTHASFKRAMLEAVIRQPSLQALTTRSDDDAAIALLDAWAVALDVLSFYQERLINESNVRTATELRSVLELARAIGYELRPGVAASTMLSFTVDDIKEQPIGTLMPRGTRVQSIPGQDERPQMFETSDDLMAKAGWNVLLPRQRRLVVPVFGSKHVCLQGTSTQLKPGDPILIVGDENVKNTKVNRWDFRRVKTVTPTFDGDESKACTMVTWDKPLGKQHPFSEVAKEHPRVYALRQRAAVFGHNAQQWTSLTQALKDSNPGNAASTDWKDFDFPVNPQALDLDAVYPAIAEGSWLVLDVADSDYRELYRVSRVVESARAQFLLTAKVSRVTLDGEHWDKFRTRRRETVVFAHSEELQMTEELRTDPVAGRTIEVEPMAEPLPSGRWLIFTGTCVGETKSSVELVQVESVNDSFITLKSDLAHTYERSTARFFANTTAATHGEMKREVLGSGDGSLPFQRFILKQTPLTFVSSVSPTGSTSTLEVRVNGLLWKEVATLYDAGPNDRVFITRRDAEARTLVQFGDGHHGARLPTGIENVLAAYRVGVGLSGNVRATQLSLLMDRPLGAKDAINYQPATGGADAETLDQARTNAPMTVMTLDRIVSLRDYEDFARSFAGVGKAQAQPLWSGEERLVHLTIAGADGGQVAEDSALFRHLLAAIDGAHHAARPVRVASCELRYFKTRAGIVVDGDYIKAAVLAAVAKAVSQAFAFATRNFGQTVTASELIAIMQRVNGVVAVDLDALHFSDAPASLQARLPSHVARWELEDIKPAELLLVQKDGIELFSKL